MAVTWAELHRRGARWGTEKGQIFFEAPADVEPELVADIHRRVPMMRNPPLLDVPRTGGACDACGEPLPYYKGGWCPLCTAAREVALRPAKARAA